MKEYLNISYCDMFVPRPIHMGYLVYNVGYSVSIAPLNPPFHKGEGLHYNDVSHAWVQRTKMTCVHTNKITREAMLQLINEYILNIKLQSVPKYHTHTHTNNLLYFLQMKRLHYIDVILIGHPQ